MNQCVQSHRHPLMSTARDIVRAVVAIKWPQHDPHKGIFEQGTRTPTDTAKFLVMQSTRTRGHAPPTNTQSLRGPRSYYPRILVERRAMYRHPSEPCRQTYSETRALPPPPCVRRGRD